MISIKNLTIKYKDYKVINDLTLHLKKGSITALMGESGTGKTSLAHSILNICKGDVSGEIFVDNIDILKFSQDELKEYRWNKASLVFQNSGNVLNPSSKIINQITESMSNKNSSDINLKKGYQLLKKVGLHEKFYDYYPNQLSGGMIQRVLIAMALANDPDIIIFDEPTSALDSIHRAQIIDLIKEVSKEKTVLLISHNFSVAKDIADKAVFLYGGRVMESGKMANILAYPKHPYTRGLLRSYPNMSTTKDLQGIMGNHDPSLKGCPFANRCTQSIEKCYIKTPNLELIDNRNLACHRKGNICLMKLNYINKFYNKNKVLNNISLNIYQGETVSIIGESGSGKTTLAKIIMGQVKCESGFLFFNEKPLNKFSKDFYSNVQLIHQNPRSSINNLFNIYKVIKEPLDIQGYLDEDEKLEKIVKILKDVHLPYDELFLNRFPSELSGGELQRLVIARALALDPKLIIADEATSALDVSVQAKIVKLFLELQELKGLTLIFITHNIALARKISDKLAVMKDGTIIEQGNTTEIIENPKNEYTKLLLDSGPKLF